MRVDGISFLLLQRSRFVLASLTQVLFHQRFSVLYRMIGGRIDCLVTSNDLKNKTESKKSIKLKLIRKGYWTDKALPCNKEKMSARRLKIKICCSWCSVALPRTTQGHLVAASGWTDERRKPLRNAFRSQRKYNIIFLLSIRKLRAQIVKSSSLSILNFPLINTKGKHFRLEKMENFPFLFRC